MVRARIVERDKALPHQIVLFLQKGTHQFGVSCLCKPAGRPGSYVAFELRTSLEGHEARRIWLEGRHSEAVAPFDHNAIAAARRGSVVWVT